MKNKNGITLIALVITIIVLLILAGVSLSITLGENGIIAKSQNAVVKNREAKAKEEVEMAWSSVKSEYLSDWTKDSTKKLKDYISKENLNSYLEGKGQLEEDPVIRGDVYEVKYRAVDQNKLYTFLVSQDGKMDYKTGIIISRLNLNIEPTKKATLTAELVGITGEISWDSNNTSVVEVNENGEVTAISKGIARVTVRCGDKTDYCDILVADKLSTVVKTGDYVNINVGYMDQMDKNKDYTTSNKKIAWRVFSKDESTGIVKLISTGHPFSFYHYNNSEKSLNIMKKINTENISITTGSGSDSAVGFQKNGFQTTNIKELFNNKKVFSKIPISFPTSTEIGAINQSSDLRTTGKWCWLGEAYATGTLQYVHPDGRTLFNIGLGGSDCRALRPVITIISGVTIKDGEGNNESPYELNGIIY